jgi:carboxyl-terminal processing protease
MVEFLRGEKASIVRVIVARSGVDTLIEVSIERDVIPLKSVPAAYMINDSTGYIQINHFSARTYREFMDHLERLTQEEGMKDLIIDVRRNPGGYLKEAVNILSQLFEEKGLLLVYTEGARSPKTEYRTTGNPFYPVDQIVVLVDGSSASASEILAGAIQDHDRGVVIGSTTYGKGLVQEQYGLSNGGALRLTIARYFTPSGRLIQKPYSNGDAIEDNGQDVGDSTIYHTVSGRPVNGSGGITPDYPVASEFNWEDKRMWGLYVKLLQYALHGYRDDRTYESWEDILERFPSAGELAADIERYYASIGDTVRFDATQFAGLEEQSRQALMAMIASDQFGYEAWFRVLNGTDPVMQKALEVIRDDRRVTLKVVD